MRLRRATALFTFENQQLRECYSPRRCVDSPTPSLRCPSLTHAVTDEKPCQCHQGLKCTCALKKEPSSTLDVPRPGLEPFFDRQSGKPHIPNRRSEGSIPRYRNTYQPGLHRTGYSQEPGVPYQALSSPLARQYHAAQRSVDSLPLFLNQSASPTLHTSLPPTAFQNGQMLDPNQQYQNSYHDNLTVGSGNRREVPSFGHYNVEPLAEDVLERTLSPRNPNRHSISGAISGQWAMMLNSDLTRLGQQESPESVYGLNSGSEPQHFTFPSAPAPGWQNSWANVPQQQSPMHAPPQSVAGHSELMVPGQISHSRSSSGTVSDQFDPPSYSSNQPIIQIDPTWIGQDDKGWSAGSYQDVPPDFNFPGEAQLPNYSDDFSVTDHSDFGDFQSYSFPSADSRHTSLDDVYPSHHDLPDRSIKQWGHTGTSSLPQFKFPPDEPYVGNQTHQYDWQATQYDGMMKQENNGPHDG